MAVYWITEAVPLAVTALLPLILFPILGVLTAKTVAMEYLQDPLMLFTGGFFVAIAVEQSQLHRRIALKALLLVGENPKWILFGLMTTTGFLSMWISNTAATAMMLPILEAILVEIIKDKRSNSRLAVNGISPETILISDKNLENGTAKMQYSEKIALNAETLKEDELNLCKMMFLSICYSSNIGGVGTLTGTPPNIIVVGMLETKYGATIGVSYASWMGLSVPIVVINIIFAWILLQIFFLGWKRTFSFKSKQNEDNVSGVKAIMRSHYENLGPMSFKEISVAVLFGILVLLWILRSPKFMPGWGDLFEPKYVSDATAAMFIAFLLFVLPSEMPDFLCNPKRDKRKNPAIREPLVTWSVVQNKFPWGLLLLIGSSFAMAGAIQKSGLSAAIGNNLAKLSYLSPFGICAVAAILATFVTEITSNSATASVLAPVLAAVAEMLHVNPLYLVLTTTICVSYAFMLPVATAPNAIVFGYGLLKVIDMVKIGFFMNCITVLVTLFAMNTWGMLLFNLGTYPSWAPQLNNTILEIVSNSTILP
jgi:sodium-dependent dicarboxylate transporter 2/3/5